MYTETKKSIKGKLGTSARLLLSASDVDGAGKCAKMIMEVIEIVDTFETAPNPVERKPRKTKAK